MISIPSYLSPEEQEAMQEAFYQEALYQETQLQTVQEANHAWQEEHQRLLSTIDLDRIPELVKK